MYIPGMVSLQKGQEWSLGQWRKGRMAFSGERGAKRLITEDLLNQIKEFESCCCSNKESLEAFFPFPFKNDFFCKIYLSS